MIQSSRGYTVVTDTVSWKSGGKWGPEMIVRIQGEVAVRSCPNSQSRGSNLKAIYQFVELLHVFLHNQEPNVPVYYPPQIQSPSSGHPGPFRWKIGPWPGVYEGESSAVFSSAVCGLFPTKWKTWRSFSTHFSDLKSKEGGGEACCTLALPVQ